MMTDASCDKPMHYQRFRNDYDYTADCYSSGNHMDMDTIAGTEITYFG